MKNRKLRTALIALIAGVLLGAMVPVAADQASVSDAHQTRRIAKLERQIDRMKHNSQHRRIKVRQALNGRVSNKVGALRQQVYGELNYRTDVIVCMIDTLEAEVRSVPAVPCAEQREGK